MKLEGKAKNAVIGAMLARRRVAGAFWILVLSPKREEASELGGQVNRLETRSPSTRPKWRRRGGAQASSRSTTSSSSCSARPCPATTTPPRSWSRSTGSPTRLEVQVRNPQTRAPAPAANDASACRPSGTADPVSPTEMAASTLPLGATVGPAGLAVMPYKLTFTGDFFQIADFIKGLDALVKTNNEKVGVDGRLVTVDGFSLEGLGRGLPDAGSDVRDHHLPDPARAKGVTAGATPEAARSGDRDAGFDHDGRRAMKRLKGTGAEDAGAEGPALPDRPLLGPARSTPAAPGRSRRGRDRRRALPARRQVGASGSGRGAVAVATAATEPMAPKARG